MNVVAAKNEPQGENLFPIRTISELTGVNAITLRAWERRYGLFEPIRKASGHRLYTREHIDLINRVVGLLDRGMRISQVKAHLEAEEVRSEEESGEAGDTWSRYVRRWCSASTSFCHMRRIEGIDVGWLVVWHS